MLCDVMDYRRLKIWYVFDCAHGLRPAARLVCYRCFHHNFFVVTNRLLNDVKILKAIVFLVVTRGAQIRNSLSRSGIRIVAFYWFIR